MKSFVLRLRRLFDPRSWMSRIARTDLSLWGVVVFAAGVFVA